MRLKMARQGSIWLGVVLGLSLAAAAPAEERTKTVTVDDIRLGQPVLGAEVLTDRLKGRVVLLEFWGIH
jgi:hypothetical protein